uniref:Uncharacterized protein n=1 Tax=Arundo donax TaxID=35708 RepID=A0A0A9FB72_ARUDO
MSKILFFTGVTASVKVAPSWVSVHLIRPLGEVQRVCSRYQAQSPSLLPHSPNLSSELPLSSSCPLLYPRARHTAHRR